MLLTRGLVAPSFFFLFNLEHRLSRRREETSASFTFTQASTFKVLLSNAAASRSGWWAKPSNWQRTHNHDTQFILLSHHHLLQSHRNTPTSRVFLTHTNTRAQAQGISQQVSWTMSPHNGIFLSLLHYNFLLNQSFFSVQGHDISR